LEKSTEKFSAAVAKSGKFLSRRRRWVKKNFSFRAAAAGARKFLSRRRRRTKKNLIFEPPPPIEASAYTSNCDLKAQYLRSIIL
jgi:hypothetical protein